MPTYRVAHIKEQGIDLIIVPLSSDFGHKDSQQQNEIIEALQAHATGAGLAGTVVPVWDAGSRRMGFVAPSNWHSFFGSLTLARVFASINKQISW